MAGTIFQNTKLPQTLETMVKGLNSPTGTLMIMDRGIATAAKIDWIVSKGYRYLVVNRERARVLMRLWGSLSSPLMVMKYQCTALIVKIAKKEGCSAVLPYEL
jgi:hypothetical protein